MAWHEAFLRCPDCSGPLRREGNHWQCLSCAFSSPDIRDLRPQQPHSQTFARQAQVAFNPLERLHQIATEPPELSFEGPRTQRDSREFFSVLEKRLKPGARLLDLGCGSREHEAPANALELDYVGIDIGGDQADMLADAHALPFDAGSFDAVLSYAVFEHLYDPALALTEVRRVLKPGGLFLGAVSNGEPFHESFFHPTPWGVIALFEADQAFAVERLWASMDTLRSLSRMGRYARLIKKTLGLLDTINRRCPFLTPRKMRWPAKNKQLEKVYTSGSIAFVAIAQA